MEARGYPTGVFSFHVGLGHPAKVLGHGSKHLPLPIEQSCQNLGPPPSHKFLVVCFKNIKFCIALRMSRSSFCRPSPLTIILGFHKNKGCIAPLMVFHSATAEELYNVLAVVSFILKVEMTIFPRCNEE